VSFAGRAPASVAHRGRLSGRIDDVGEQHRSQRPVKERLLITDAREQSPDLLRIAGARPYQWNDGLPSWWEVRQARAGDPLCDEPGALNAPVLAFTFSGADHEGGHVDG
jgi:hypothetical protein